MTETESFLKRTDLLASTLRLSLRELALKIGLSGGSFFGYRTGRIRITNKAWAKLEAAERAAGLSDRSDKSDMSDRNPANNSGNPKETEAAEEKKNTVAELASEVAALRDQLAVLTGALAALVRGGAEPPAAIPPPAGQPELQPADGWETAWGWGEEYNEHETCAEWILPSRQFGKKTWQQQAEKDKADDNQRRYQ